MAKYIKAKYGMKIGQNFFRTPHDIPIAECGEKTNGEIEALIDATSDDCPKELKKYASSLNTVCVLTIAQAIGNWAH